MLGGAGGAAGAFAVAFAAVAAEASGRRRRTSAEGEAVHCGAWE